MLKTESQFCACPLKIKKGEIILCKIANQEIQIHAACEKEILWPKGYQVRVRTLKALIVEEVKKVEKEHFDEDRRDS